MFLLAIMVTTILALLYNLFMPMNAGAFNVRDDIRGDPNTLVLIPIMTANAYKFGGYYDYYSGKCDESCLTVYVDQSLPLSEPSSKTTTKVLKNLGYNYMSDFQAYQQLKHNPSFLNNYDKLIILHMEYIPVELFNAVNNHKKVIYLNPNAMYAEIKINKFEMTLVAGHDYNGKYNAFDWEYENTPLEYDKECKTWKFEPIRNGYQLNCNPELIIHKNFEMLKVLKNL